MPMVPQIFLSAARSSCVVGPLRLLSARSGRARSKTLLSKALRLLRWAAPHRAQAFYRLFGSWRASWLIGVGGQPAFSGVSSYSAEARSWASVRMGLEDLGLHYLGVLFRT